MTARPPEPTEDERRHALRDLAGVGPSKPMGYLPLRTIRNFVRLSPKAVAADAAARGLASAQFGTRQCRISSGALYVYDRAALAGLLRAHAEVLDAAGVPRDPDGFVAHVAAVWYAPGHPLHAVIGLAFGDPC